MNAHNLIPAILIVLALITSHCLAYTCGIDKGLRIWERIKENKP